MPRGTEKCRIDSIWQDIVACLGKLNFRLFKGASHPQKLTGRVDCPGRFTGPDPALTRAAQVSRHHWRCLEVSPRTQVSATLAV